MSAFDSSVKKVSNLPSTLGQKTAANSLAVTLPSDQGALDVSPFPAALTPVYQKLHGDGLLWNPTTAWPAPYDTAKSVRLLDMAFSTDAATALSLWQARKADYLAKLQADGAANVWKLDDASGNAVDSVGSATLTAVGTPTYGSGSLVTADGSAVEFNGTAHAFKTATKLASTTVGAFECWLWMTAPPAGTQVIAAATDEAAANDYMRFSVLSTYKPNLTMRNTASGFLWNATAETLIGAKIWTHLVWQHDGSGLECYVNGRRVAITYANGNDSTAAWYNNVYSAVDNFSLAYWNNAGAGANWMGGRLAMCAWYTASKAASVWDTHYKLGAPLWGPHYLGANGGLASGLRTPLSCLPGYSLYAKASAGANMTLDLAGWEA